MRSFKRVGRARSDYPSSVRKLIVVVLPSELCSSFSIVTGFPEAFTNAHAIARALSISEQAFAPQSHGQFIKQFTTPNVCH